MSKKNNVNDNASESNKDEQMVFDKINYQLMMACIGLLVLGFSVMMMETGEYGIGVLGLTVGPIIVVLGFVVAFAAIMYKSKKADGSN